MTRSSKSKQSPKFIYRNKTTNLGDLLCSPKLYFRIVVDKPLNIFGGGVWSKPKNNSLRDIGENNVLWGAGLSERTSKSTPQDLERICSLTYSAWGFRDKDQLQSEEHFLPCVSCMHPMLDDVKNIEGVGLLYINADPKIVSIGSLIKLKKIAKRNRFSFVTNRASEQEFFLKWRQAKKIITNSYHGAYWSLLAGKDVVLFGHSSKFRSLLKSFNLKEDFLVFRKGNQGELISAAEESFMEWVPLRLSDPQAKLIEYRSRQLEFLENMRKRDLIIDWSMLKPDSAEVLSSKKISENSQIFRAYAESFLPFKVLHRLIGAVRRIKYWLAR
jgi:hypothetical protein